MDNLFLYAVKPSATFHQVEQFFRTSSLNGKLIVLPPGSQFISPLCLQLRSNDLFILFARDQEDINELLLQRDEYESFRIILIFENRDKITGTKYSLLSPRFIAFFDENLDELLEYLKKVLNKNESHYK